MMRKISEMILFFLTFVIAISGCKKEEEAIIMTGEVIPPIIKYVSMPSQSSTIPGKNVYINGIGFSTTDTISCRSLEGEIDFVTTPVSADDYGVTIFIPENAGGEYEVSVTRAGLTSVLEERLNVAFVFTLNNLSVPVSVSAGETLIISGQ